MKLRQLRFSNLAFNQSWDGVRVVDFDDMPESAIIRVRGITGEGKSTIMSLSGPATLFCQDPNQGDLKSLANVGDAFTELTFDIGGKTYIARVDIRSYYGVQSGVDNVLKQNTNWALYEAGNEAPIATGSKGYKEAIEALVGPIPDFLAIAYQLQRTNGYPRNLAASFVDATASEREEILKRYIDVASIDNVIVGTTMRLQSLRAELKDLSGKLGDIDEEKARLAETQEDLAAQQQAVAEAQAASEGRAAELASVEEARQTLTQRQSDAQAAQREIADLEAKRSLRIQIGERIADLQREIQAYESALTTAREAVEAQRTRVEAAKRDNADAAARAERYAEASRAVKSIEGELTQAQTALTAKRGVVTSLESRIAAANAAKDAATAKLAPLAEKARSAQQNAELAQLDLDGCRGAVTEAEKAATECEKNEAQPAVQSLHAARDAFAEARQHARDATNKVVAARSDLERAKGVAGECDGVPCKGQGEFASCKLLLNAVQARESLPSLTQVLQAAESVEQSALTAQREREIEGSAAAAANADAAARLQELRDDLAGKRAALAEVESIVKTAKETVSAADAERVQAEGEIRSQELTLVSLGEQIASAQSAVQEAEQRVHAAAQRLSEARAKLGSTPAPDETQGAAIARAESELTRLLGEQTTAERAKADLEQRITDARVELAPLPGEDVIAAGIEVARARVEAAPTSEQMEASNTTIAAARAQHAEAKTTAEEAVGRLRELKGKLEGCEQRLRELKPFQEQADYLGAEVRNHDWLLAELRRLVGQHIDEHLDTVTHVTNELLDHVSDGRWQVRFEVESETKSSKKIERKYRIFVSDTNAGGDEREVGRFSGGQMTVVRLAIQCGLSALANTVRERPLQTMWLDEFDAAVDGETSMRDEMQALLRAFVEQMETMVGPMRIFVVSHAEEFPADYELRARDVVPVRESGDVEMGVAA